MKDDLFAVIQVPFADFRRFIPDPPNLVSRPSWPSPSSNEFVRKFGGVRSRQFGQTGRKDSSFIDLAFPTERHYIDASWHLLREQKLVDRDGLRARSQVQFLRLIGDQQAVVRFELGIRINAEPKLWHNINRLEDVLAYLINDRLFQVKSSLASSGNGQTSKKPINLSSLSSSLRRSYFSAAALHDGTGVPPQFNGRFLKPLDWSAFIELPANRYFRWLREISLIGDIDRVVDIAVLRSPDAKGGNARLSPSIAVSGNHSRRSRDEVRRFRIHYLRMRAELQALWQVFSEFRTGGLLEPYLLDDSYHKNLRAELRTYLERSVNRVLDTLGADRRTTKNGRLLEVLWAEDLVSEGFLETIASRTEQFLGTRLSSRVVESLTRQGGVTNVFVGGAHVVGGKSLSKYEFKGPVTGAVGDGARASDFVANLSGGTADQASLDALAQELSKLIEHIKGEHGGDAQSKDVVAALEAAKSAAEKGEQSSVLPALKAAAAWTFEKASLIGIPVAVAALKKALGL